MPVSPRHFLIVALAPLVLAACQAQDPASPGPAVVVALPAPPPPPFPPGGLPPEQAEIVLAGDPMALRFLALKQLGQLGLVPADDCAARKDANLGALLPLTVEAPPAAGLDLPIPPLAVVVGRFQALDSGQGRGTDATRAAERDFLADALLPRAPERRQGYAPPDMASARKLQDRLGRLEDAGLITPEQRAKEQQAVDDLIAGGTLPATVAAPAKPVEETKPAKPKKTAGRGNRMPGGVSGQLRVVPSPAGVEAPRLAHGAKGPAGIHLLSMGSAAHGDKAWETLAREHPELGGLGHMVSRADLGDLGVTYRLLAGPMEPAQAEDLCAKLKPRGQMCVPTPFPAAAK